MSEARYLIDTNVLSELARPAPEPHLVDWLSTLVRPATSALVCYELARGIERLAADKRKRFLESWLAELLRALETIPLDERSALAAARIERAAHQAGRSVEVRDLLIVATTQVEGCQLATRNVDDMRGLGVMVYDPFSDTRTM